MTIIEVDQIRTVPLDVTSVLEVTDVEVGDTAESIDIGPFTGSQRVTYLRLRSTNLVVVADELHLLADRIIDSVLDARQAKADSEQVECPGCRTRIDPDMTSCGSPRCERVAAQEATL